MPTPAGAALRKRLVDAVVRAIERDGIEDLSLRRIASDAGVSRQAPYLCFVDKREMLAAAAAAAMARERHQWQRALATTGDPLGRMIALANAHVKFARGHPHLSALVEGPYVAKSDLDELQREAIASFALVRETVAACLPRRTPIERARQCTVIVWATLKGLVELDANRQVPASVPGGIDQLAEDAVRTLVRGWRR